MGCHQLEEWVGGGQVTVRTDDHPFHEQVCVAQVCESLVVLSFNVVVEHLGDQPGVCRIFWGVDLQVQECAK